MASQERADDGEGHGERVVGLGGAWLHGRDPGDGDAGRQGGDGRGAWPRARGTRPASFCREEDDGGRLVGWAGQLGQPGKWPW